MTSDPITLALSTTIDRPEPEPVDFTAIGIALSVSFAWAVVAFQIARWAL